MARVVNFPKTIFEQFDVELCKLERKVKNLQLQKNYWPIYNKTRLPRLVNGEGFMTDNGQFCIYVSGENAIYCMPGAGRINGPVPFVFTLLLQGLRQPGGATIGNSSSNMSGASAINIPSNIYPSGGGFVSQNHWLRDRSGIWREAGGSPYQAWTVRGSTQTLINEFDIPGWGGQSNGVELPLGDGYRMMTHMIEPPDGRMVGMYGDSDTYPVYQTQTKVLIYDVITGSYVVALDQMLPIGGTLPGSGKLPQFIGEWSYDGQRVHFASYRIAPSINVPHPEEIYGQYPLDQIHDHYIYSVGGGSEIFDTSGLGWFVGQFRWNPVDHRYYYTRLYTPTGSSPTTSGFELVSSAYGVIYSEQIPTTRDPFLTRFQRYKISPDGSTIAFLHTDSTIAPGQNIIYHLYTMDTAGLNVQRISDVGFGYVPYVLDVDANDVSFDWSPDGQYIAVMQAGIGGGATYIVTVDSKTTSVPIATFFGSGVFARIQDWAGDNAFTYYGGNP